MEGEKPKGKNLCLNIVVYTYPKVNYQHIDGFIKKHTKK